MNSYTIIQLQYIQLSIMISFNLYNSVRHDSCSCLSTFFSCWQRFHTQDLDLHTPGRYFVRNQMLGASRFRLGLCKLVYTAEWRENEGKLMQAMQFFNDFAILCGRKQFRISAHHLLGRRMHTDPMNCVSPVDLRRCL